MMPAPIQPMASGREEPGCVGGIAVEDSSEGSRADESVEGKLGGKAWRESVPGTVTMRDTRTRGRVPGTKKPALAEGDRGLS